MRVIIRKRTDEGSQVIVDPGRGAHMPVVLLEGVTEENCRDVVGVVLREILGGPKAPK